MTMPHSPAPLAPAAGPALAASSLDAATSPSAPTMALQDAVAILSTTPAPSADAAPLYSLAYVSLVTRLASSAAATSRTGPPLGPVHAQLLAAHWPAMANLAHAAAQRSTSSDVDVAGARAVTAALHLTVLGLGGGLQAAPSPGSVLALWISSRAYDLPLFYASIKLHCDQGPESAVARVLPALWTSPTFFPVPMLALRWLYLWSKLAEAWPASKRTRLVNAILSTATASSSPTAPTATTQGLQLAHLATTGILSHLPPTSLPPARLTTLIHSIAAAAPPAIDTQVFAYALVFLSAPRHQAWPPLSRSPNASSLAALLAPHLTHTLCTNILPNLIPAPGVAADPMNQLWLPLVGPLGHLLGSCLVHSPAPARAALIPRIVAAYAAVHPRMLTSLDSVPQSLLFLAVMLVQDLVASGRAADSGEGAAPHLAALLALVHPLTLKLAQFVPGAPPFPSYADVLADLTTLVVAAEGLHGVDNVCEQVLLAHVQAAASPATLAFLATWLVSDARLLALAPRWALDRVAGVAGTQPPPPPPSSPAGSKGEIVRVAWEAAQWLVVQVLERPLGADSSELASAKAEWWPWYVDVWWPLPGEGGAQADMPSSTALVQEIRWRATSALAAAVADGGPGRPGDQGEKCRWLLERVCAAAPHDVVALCMLVNAVPRSEMRDVMRKVEQVVARAWLSKDAAVAVVEQWGRVGGLRWDRAVEVARWWNRVVDQAGLR